MIDKLIDYTPYWIAHALVAAVISFLALWMSDGFFSYFAGSMFYLGREIRDWEKLHDWKLSGFDWKGLLWPIIANLIMLYLM